MRTTLMSVMVVLAQWGLPANAQSQASPPAPSGYVAHPPAKRLFFFTSDPMDLGRPAMFGNPAQAPRRPYFLTNPVPRNPAHGALTFPPTGLVPLESLPSQNLWKFFRPQHSRLFFFTKP